MCFTSPAHPPGERRSRWNGIVGEEYASIDAVLAHARSLSAGGRIEEAWRLLRRARLAWRGRASDRALLGAAIAWASLQLGRAGRGLFYATEAMTLAALLSDSGLLIRTGALRAWLLLEVGRGVEAAAEAVQARARAESTSDCEAASWAFNVLGCVYWYSRHLDRAEECCARAVELARVGGEPVLVGWWLINLAGILDQRGRDASQSGAAAPGCVARGRALGREAIQLLKDAGENWGLSIAVLNLAGDLVSHGDQAEAQACMTIIAGLPEVDGTRNHLQRLDVQGRFLLGEGRVAEAADLLRDSLALSESCDNHEGILQALDGLASVLERLDRYREACQLLRRRQALAPRVLAEGVQERARLTEALLGLRTLENKVAAAEHRLEAAHLEALLLVEDSRRDPLTGVANRRRFEEVLRALGPTRLYAVAMIDIDFFKSINDRFSHLFGDEVLRTIAEALATRSRPGDLVARLGGEEFAILLPDTTAAAAARMCRHLRLAVGRRSWSAAGSLRVTASFGIADSSEDATSTGVLARADSRLYVAKRTGRNRVVARAAPRLAHRASAELAAPEMKRSLVARADLPACVASGELVEAMIRAPQGSAPARPRSTRLLAGRVEGPCG